MTGPRIAGLPVLIAALLAACAIQDLNQDIDEIVERYGYFKGQVRGNGDQADVLIVLMRDINGTSTAEELRTVRYDELFYALVARGDYIVVAFEDSNGDFAYQAGEPAARIANPTINWFSGMDGQSRVDPDSLITQPIELSPSVILDDDYDLSLEGARALTRNAANFLRVVTWDDPNFTDDIVRLGMWEPRVFEEDVGFGLYLLDEFDASKKSVLLVHGINDSPRTFESLAAEIPDEYQILLYHYPSAFPLNYSSYALSELLNELVQRYDIPRIDVVAHSMGGLVSKGMIVQASPEVRMRLHNFVTISSPFGGHSAAAQGVRWSPVIAPVWWAMSPGSDYLTAIGDLDLGQGPSHYLIYTFAHEAGGERQDDDGVVSVDSQLAQSARMNATAEFGIADNHTGVLRNDQTFRLLGEILGD